MLNGENTLGSQGEEIRLTNVSDTAIMTEYRDLNTQQHRLRIWVNKDQAIPFMFSNKMFINPSLPTTWHFYETDNKVGGADPGLDELEGLKKLVSSSTFFFTLFLLAL